MGIERTARHETMLYQLSRDPTLLRSFVPGGHNIGNPEPIFREIKLEEAEIMKQKFSGATVDI